MEFSIFILLETVTKKLLSKKSLLSALYSAESPSYNFQTLKKLKKFSWKILENFEILKVPGSWSFQWEIFISTARMVYLDSKSPGVYTPRLGDGLSCLFSLANGLENGLAYGLDKGLA